MRGWICGIVSPVRAAFLLAVCLRDVPGASGARALLPNCYGKRDFLIADGPRPMQYSSALAQFWRCLSTYTSFNSQESMKFTLHSLKASTLSACLLKNGQLRGTTASEILPLV